MMMPRHGAELGGVLSRAQAPRTRCQGWPGQYTFGTHGAVQLRQLPPVCQDQLARGPRHLEHIPAAGLLNLQLLKCRSLKAGKRRCCCWLLRPPPPSPRPPARPTQGQQARLRRRPCTRPYQATQTVPQAVGQWEWSVAGRGVRLGLILAATMTHGPWPTGHL